MHWSPCRHWYSYALHGAPGRAVATTTQHPYQYLVQQNKTRKQIWTLICICASYIFLAITFSNVLSIPCPFVFFRDAISLYFSYKLTAYYWQYLIIIKCSIMPKKHLQDVIISLHTLYKFNNVKLVHIYIYIYICEPVLHLHSLESGDKPSKHIIASP